MPDHWPDPTLMFFCPHCRKVLGFGYGRMI